MKMEIKKFHTFKLDKKNVLLKIEIKYSRNQFYSCGVVMLFKILKHSLCFRSFRTSTLMLVIILFDLEVSTSFLRCRYLCQHFKLC